MASEAKNGFVHLLATSDDGCHEPQIFRMRDDQPLRKFARAYATFRELSDSDVTLRMTTPSHGDLDPMQTATVYGLADGDQVFFSTVAMSTTSEPHQQTAEKTPVTPSAPSSEVTPPPRRNVRTAGNVPGPRSLDQTLDASSKKPARKRANPDAVAGQSGSATKQRRLSKGTAKGTEQKAAAASTSPVKASEGGRPAAKIGASRVVLSSGFAARCVPLKGGGRARSLTSYFGKGDAEEGALVQAEPNAPAEKSAPSTLSGHSRSMSVAAGPAKSWKVTAWLRQDAQWGKPEQTNAKARATNWLVSSPGRSRTYQEWGKLQKEVSEGVYTQLYTAVRPDLLRKIHARRQVLQTRASRQKQKKQQKQSPQKPPPQKQATPAMQDMLPPPVPKRKAKQPQCEVAQAPAPRANLDTAFLDTQPFFLQAPPPRELPPAAGWACSCEGHLKRHPRCIAANQPTLVHLRDYMLIGRAETCDVTIDSRRTPMMISRSHVVLNRKDGSFALTDQGSLNGVLINGERLQGKQALSHGDVVTFGVPTPHPELDYIFEARPNGGGEMQRTAMFGA